MVTAVSECARLIGLGLLVHEAVYFSSKGPRHFTDDILPFLGLHLAPVSRVLVHVSFCASAAAFAIAPLSPWILGWLLASLAVITASFPRRIPNHLVVSLFFLLLIATSWESWTASTSEWRVWVGLLAAATLLGAGFHKLNHGFFRPSTSCGSGLVCHYLLQRGVPISRVPTGLLLMSTVGVVALELLLPVALAFSWHWKVTVATTALLVTMFGFLGHHHFAIIMLGLLSVFVPEHGPSAPWSTIAIISVATSAALANVRGYAFPWLTRLNALLLAGACAYVLSRVLLCTSSATPLTLDPVSSWGSALVLGMFVMNTAAPYFGLKWDGSLAMFSNLRPDEWEHFIVRRRVRGLTPRYVAVPADSARALRLDGELAFPDPNGLYAIGYVWEVAREASRRSGRVLQILVTEHRTAREWVVRGRAEELAWYERISTFPHYLPLSPEPLCG